MDTPDRLLTVFKKLSAIDSTMPVGVMIVFAELIKQDGITVSDLHKKIDVPIQTLQRQIRYLTNTLPAGKRGVDLAYLQPNPADRREKFIHLSTAGLALMRVLSETIEY